MWSEESSHWLLWIASAYIHAYIHVRKYTHTYTYAFQGVNNIILCGAKKVPADYFGSHLLREPETLRETLKVGIRICVNACMCMRAFRIAYAAWAWGFERNLKGVSICMYVRACVCMRAFRIANAAWAWGFERNLQGVSICMYVRACGCMRAFRIARAAWDEK